MGIEPRFHGIFYTEESEIIEEKKAELFRGT